MQIYEEKYHFKDSADFSFYLYYEAGQIYFVIMLEMFQLERSFTT